MSDPTPYRMDSQIRGVGAVLLLVVGAVYLATAAYDRTNVDTASANIGSWRIATTGSPVLDGLDTDAMHGAPVPVWAFERADGHSVIVRTPGSVAAGVPAYLVDSLFRGDGTDTSDYRHAPGVATAALLAAVSVLLVWLALLPRWGTRTATVAAGAFAFATPMWSVTSNGLWPHTVTVLGIAGMAWGAARERWWLVGLFGGIAFWGRAHTVVITVVLALAVAWSRREPRIAVVAGGIGAVFAGLASLWTHGVWGGWMPTGGYSVAGYVGRFGAADGSSFADSPWTVLRNEAAAFVALDRGILVWTPLIVALLPALARSWRSQPIWTRALLAGGLVYTGTQGLLNPFHGGDGIYGYRLTLELLACSVPALMYAVTHCGRVARWLLGPLVALQVVAIATGAVSDDLFLQVEDLWDRNAFVAALGAPAVLVVIPLAIVTGAVAQRILQPVFRASPAADRAPPTTCRGPAVPSRT